MAEPNTGRATVGDWLDSFFEAYYRRRPVNATFIGVHDFDATLPDLSEAGVAGTLAEMQSLLEESWRLECTEASAAERLDLRLARAFLKIQSWEYGSRHFDRGNPSLYTGEAVFGVMSLFLNHGGPLDGRIDAAIQRMETIPELLRQGRTNVRAAPERWTQRALDETQGALAFLTTGIQALAIEEGITEPAFLRAAETAATGFRDFGDHLASGIKTAAATTASCGEEALAMYLADGHCLPQSADEIVAYAESQLAEANAQLADRAGDFDARDSDEALAGLATIAPDTASYLAHYQDLWDQSRAVAAREQLVTWPDFPIRYVPRPAWARAAAPSLYFLFYRSPAAYRRPPVHDYLVTPIDSSMPAPEQEALLAANNTSVIKLNHVVHHGGIGHHVQNWNAFRSSSRIGQVAAVDCASRIAMFCGGTLAEGWACYATDLMSEAGFLTPLEQYSEQASRVRMCARAIVDIKLHQGRIDLDAAASSYQQLAGMPVAAATAEAVKNSMFPGAAVIYLLGTDAIHALRAEMTSRRAGDFELGGFHDEFLAYGSVPVPLIAEAMHAAQDARDIAIAAGSRRTEAAS